MFKVAVALLCAACCPLCWTQTSPSAKPKLTLEDNFNAVDFTDVKLAPAGDAVAIATVRADWQHDRFREDLWLYRDGALLQLTRSGHDSHPQWSPDGKWIAFLSDRAAPEPAKDEKEEGKSGPDKQIYLMSAAGGEAFPATHDRDGVHSFAWAPDSQALLYAIKEPWTKKQRDEYKEQWKDVLQYREVERGDVIERVTIAQALQNAARLTELEKKAAEKSDTQKKETGKNSDDEDEMRTPGTTRIAACPYSIQELALTPQTVAFVTAPPSSRVESTREFEIYTVPLAGGAPKQLTRNEGLESELRWSSDGRQLFAQVHMGSIEGKYEDVQGRAYAIDPDSGNVQRWAKNFEGSIGAFEPLDDGRAIGIATVGVNAPLLTFTPAAGTKTGGWNGAYSHLSTAKQSKKLAFVYSSQTKPAEVYVADSVDAIATAKPITQMNAQLAAKDLPQGEAYRWTSKDGTKVEGWLLYPPGKFHAKGLRTFTLIHGGPGDADGDAFGANWYDWAALAASNGWLVFRPNYRGSTGYGDQFMRQISPHLVSLPGQDILTGVDALVRDGIADPQHLAVGGYSYGGYMTNWLLTQSDRFRSAVTGAGAVEHAANWGNDDLTFDDAWFLGGAPWQAEPNYNSEAALWQLNKVKTPTHIVGGSEDIRVYVGEQYLLERALHNLNVPSSLLIFPGEGHPLAKNPWHGRIKVREELKWLEKYDGQSAQSH